MDKLSQCGRRQLVSGTSQREVPNPINREDMHRQAGICLSWQTFDATPTVAEHVARRLQCRYACREDRRVSGLD